MVTGAGDSVLNETGRFDLKADRQVEGERDAFDDGT